MSVNVMEIQPSVKTVAEFDDLLEKYAKSNPAKHAAKLASGEYDKFRKTLIGHKEAKAEENPTPKPHK